MKQTNLLLAVLGMAAAAGVVAASEKSEINPALYPPPDFRNN